MDNLVCRQTNRAMRSPDNNDDGMHRRVEWMVPADESVLRFLEGLKDYRDDPAIQTPKSIARNVPYSRNHVGNRCRTLADHGLLEKTGKGEYRLTTKGESLLDGGLSPESLSDTG